MCFGLIGPLKLNRPHTVLCCLGIRDIGGVVVCLIEPVGFFRTRLPQPLNPDQQVIHQSSPFRLSKRTNPKPDKPKRKHKLVCFDKVSAKPSRNAPALRRAPPAVGQSIIWFLPISVSQYDSKSSTSPFRQVSLDWVCKLYYRYLLSLYKGRLQGSHPEMVAGVVCK